MATRRSAQNARYFLRFAGTATLLIAGTLVLVLYVLPQRYVLSSGFREGNLALPNPSTPFEPVSPVRVAALPPETFPEGVVRGPAELFWGRVLPLLRVGRYEEAIPLFAAYLADFPGDVGVRREYGITLASAGYGDRAVQVFERLLEFENDRALHLLLARTLRDIGRTGDAARHYAVVLAASPRDEELILEWARAHMAEEEYEPAESVLLDGLEVLPGSVALRAELARLYYYSDRLDQADEVLIGIERDELEQVEAIELRAAIDDALQVPEPAPFEPALPPPPTPLELAMQARGRGDLEEARRLYESILEGSPDDTEALRAYADLLQYELEDFEGALEILLQVERRGAAGDADTQFRMAQLEIWTDRLDEARLRLLRLFEAMRSDPAAEDVVEAEASEVTAADVATLLGDMRRWNGERPAAASWYEAALLADPEHEGAAAGLSLMRAEVDRMMVDVEQPRMGAIVSTRADTDDFLRFDAGGEWYGIHENWVWGTRAGGRAVEGYQPGGGLADRTGVFAEAEGARWWRWGTVRTALNGSLQSVRDGEIDAGGGLSVRLLGRSGRRTDIRAEYVPAWGIANTLQSMLAEVRQSSLQVTHLQPLGTRWSLAATAEGATLDHRGIAATDDNLRLAGSLSTGRVVSRGVTVGLATRALHYTGAAPEPGGIPLYWDPDLSVSVGPYASFTHEFATWWQLNARVNPGMAWISERDRGDEVAPDLSGELGLVREGVRFRTSVRVFYGQGRFSGYRSWGADLGFSARGWLGRAGRTPEAR